MILPEHSQLCPVHRVLCDERAVCISFLRFFRIETLQPLLGPYQSKGEHEGSPSVTLERLFPEAEQKRRTDNDQE